MTSISKPVPRRAAKTAAELKAALTRALQAHPECQGIQVTGLKAGDFVHTFGDAHLYSNHLEQADLQLSRTPRALPVMKINPDVASLFSFKFEDFQLEGYDPWPHIKAPVAV